jgi:hypothetical protein
MQAANVQVATNVQAANVCASSDLDTEKHATQKAFQVDSALHVETHFFIVEFAIVNHEHEIRKQHLLGLVVIDWFLDHIQIIGDFVRIYGLAKRPRKVSLFILANHRQQFTLQRTLLSIRLEILC